jgi:hypothetical protein
VAVAMVGGSSTGLTIAVLAVLATGTVGALLLFLERLFDDKAKALRAEDKPVVETVVKVNDECAATVLTTESGSFLAVGTASTATLDTPVPTTRGMEHTDMQLYALEQLSPLLLIEPEDLVDGETTGAIPTVKGEVLMDDDPVRPFIRAHQSSLTGIIPVVEQQPLRVVPVTEIERLRASKAA